MLFSLLLMIALMGSGYCPQFTDEETEAHWAEHVSRTRKRPSFFPLPQTASKQLFFTQQDPREMWVIVNCVPVCTCRQLISPREPYCSWDRLDIRSPYTTKWISQRIFQIGHKVHLPETKRNALGWGGMRGSSGSRVETITLILYPLCI